MAKSRVNLKKLKMKKTGKQRKLKTVLYVVGTAVILIMAYQIISDIGVFSDEPEGILGQAFSGSNIEEDQDGAATTWLEEVQGDAEEPMKTDETGALETND
jgi:hypothetical protein